MGLIGTVNTPDVGVGTFTVFVVAFGATCDGIVGIVGVASMP